MTLASEVRASEIYGVTFFLLCRVHLVICSIDGETKSTAKCRYFLSPLPQCNRCGLGSFQALLSRIVLILVVILVN